MKTPLYKTFFEVHGHCSIKMKCIANLSKAQQAQESDFSQAPKATPLKFESLVPFYWQNAISKSRFTKKIWLAKPPPQVT